MIILKTKEEIEIIRQGGKILAEVLNKIKAEVRPGIDTGYLEKLAIRLMEDAGGKPAFKGYESGRNGELFPTALCISINSEVVHGPALPVRMLKNGDIIGIDAGLEYKNFFTDMAITVPVGKISKEAAKLIKVTRESLELAIKKIKPGNTTNDIAAAIQTHAESSGFSVVRDLVGHGVGLAVHEDPQIPNFVIDKSFTVTLKAGMVIAIEPMLNQGKSGIKYGDDPFTILTADGKLSAHFEHTIAVTEEGCEVLTTLNVAK